MKNYARELRPQGPNTLGLNPTSPLVIGYHWLADITGYRISLVSVSVPVLVKDMQIPPPLLERAVVIFWYK